MSQITLHNGKYEWMYLLLYELKVDSKNISLFTRLRVVIGVILFIGSETWCSSHLLSLNFQWIIKRALYYAFWLFLCLNHRHPYKCVFFSHHLSPGTQFFFILRQFTISTINTMNLFLALECKMRLISLRRQISHFINMSSPCLIHSLTVTFYQAK